MKNQCRSTRLSLVALTCFCFVATMLAPVGLIAQAEDVRAVSAVEGGRQIFTVSSNLMVEREVAVTTRVSGVIEAIHVDRGDRVRKGQALATLDQREFRLDLTASEETFRMREAEYRRARELFDQKLTSEAELEQKKAAYEVARVELEKMRLLIDRSVIRAPFSGVVLDRFVRVGQKVLVDDNGPLFKISALEPLEARAYLPEAMLGSVKKGDPVSIASVQFPDVVARGRISFMSPVIEPSSGSFQVMVMVDGSHNQALRPGMAVRISFSR